MLIFFETFLFILKQRWWSFILCQFVLLLEIYWSGFLLLFFFFFSFFRSGLLLTRNDEGGNFEFNVRLSGRYGYLHFYSDAAYTMRGFNISYRYAVHTCGCMQICWHGLMCTCPYVCVCHSMCACVYGRDFQCPKHFTDIQTLFCWVRVWRCRQHL